MQIPRGPEDVNCPFWQKAMSDCCHKCPLWTQLRGQNPQTGKELADEWGCALAFLPMLLIESTRAGSRAAASADKVAAEVAYMHDSVKQANILNSAILLDERSGRSVGLLEGDVVSKQNGP